jgi:hypothetical protein
MKKQTKKNYNVTIMYHTEVDPHWAASFRRVYALNEKLREEKRKREMENEKNE